MILWGGGWLVMRVKRLDCRICQGPLGGVGEKRKQGGAEGQQERQACEISDGIGSFLGWIQFWDRIFFDKESERIGSDRIKM